MDIGKELGIENLALKNRELLIKEIVSQAEKENKLSEFAQQLNKIIANRIKEYSKLIESYPKAVKPISQLIQKANILQRATVIYRR